MKTCALFAFLILFFISQSCFGKTPKSVEADLLMSFRKIDYWFEKKGDTTIGAYDSISKANDVFAKKLKYYTGKYPFTIVQTFWLLKKESLDVISSSDGLFRIYSWDELTGGTMHFYENVTQYKTGSKVYSVLNVDTSGGQGGYIYNYSHVYTLKTDGKTYYLAIYNGIFSSRIMGKGVQVFSIIDGKLNDKVKLIKTASGLHSKLYYDYDLGPIVNEVTDDDAHYNDALKTITIPVIDDNGAVTKKRITYKFTGQYFERIKK